MQIELIGGPIDGANFEIDREHSNIGDKYYFCNAFSRALGPFLLTKEQGEQMRLPVIVYEIDRLYPRATARTNR